MLLPASPHRHLVGGRRLLIDQAQLALRAIVQADQPVEVCAHHSPIPMALPWLYRMEPW